MTGKASSSVVKLCLILLCWVLPGTAGQAQTADPGITIVLPAGRDAAQVEAIIKGLKDNGRPVTIRVEGGMKAAAPESSMAVARDGFYAKFIALRDTSSYGLDQGFVGIGDMGSIPGKFAAAWNVDAPGFSPLFLLAVIGVVMAAGYYAPWRWARRLVKPPAAPDPRSRGELLVVREAASGRSSGARGHGCRRPPGGALSAAAYGLRPRLRA